MIDDEDERQRDEDRRIDQRRDRLALHRRDDLRVLDEAPQHRVEVAAALAGEERRRVDARKQRRRARRTRRTAPARRAPARARRRARRGTPATRRGASAGRATARAACPPCSSVASSWLKMRNSRLRNRRAPGRLQREPRPQAALRLQRQDVQALSPRARGAAALRSRRRTRLRRFHRWRREPAAEFHRSDRLRSGRNGLQAWTLVVADYTKLSAALRTFRPRTALNELDRVAPSWTRSSELDAVASRTSRARIAET